MRPGLIRKGDLLVVGTALLVVVVRLGSSERPQARPTATPFKAPLVELASTPDPYSYAPPPSARIAPQTAGAAPTRLEPFARFQYGEGFDSVTVSPDGRYIVVEQDRTTTMVLASTFEPLWSVDRLYIDWSSGWDMARGRLHLQTYGWIDSYDLRSGAYLGATDLPVDAFGAGRFSPDGRLLLLPDNIGGFLIFDVAGGEISHSFSGSYSPDAIVWLPASDAFAFIDPTGVYYCDLAGADRCHNIVTGMGIRDLEYAEFAPDGQLVLLRYWRGDRGWLSVGEVRTGRVLWARRTETYGWLAWLNDGQTLVNRHWRIVLDARTGRRIQIDDREAWRVPYVAFADQHRTYLYQTDSIPAVVDAGEVTMVGIPTLNGEFLAGISGGDSDIRLLSQSPYTIAAWDGSTGEEVAVLAGGFGSAPVQTAFSPDHQQVAFRTGTRVFVWRPFTNQPPLPLIDSRGVGELHWLADNRRMAAAQNERAVIWDAGTGRPQRRFDVTGEAISYIAVSPDGRQLAAATGGGSISVWDVDRGEELAHYRSRQPVYRLRWSPDGQMLAALVKVDNRVNLLVWMAQSGDYIGSLRVVSRFIAFNWLDDNQIAVVTYPTVSIWNPFRDRVTDIPLEDPPASPVSIEFLFGGRLAAYSPVDSRIDLWEIASGQRLASIAAPDLPSGGYQGVSLSPDGNWLAAGIPAILQVWRIVP